VDAYEIHLFVLQGTQQTDYLTLNARAELNEYEAKGHGQRVSLGQRLFPEGTTELKRAECFGRWWEIVV
jgi:hypothetical protein